MFSFARRNGNCAGCRNLADTLEATRRKVDALEYDLAQLAERFKRWQGRVSKQQALDLDEPPEAPPSRGALRPVGDDAGRAEAARVIEVRRGQRTWPGGGR